MDMAVSPLLERFESLIDENAVLTRALAQAQQHCTRLAAEHAALLRALRSELLRPCFLPGASRRRSFRRLQAVRCDDRSSGAGGGAGGDER